MAIQQDPVQNSTAELGWKPEDSPGRKSQQAWPPSYSRRVNPSFSVVQTLDSVLTVAVGKKVINLVALACSSPSCSGG